MKSLKAKFRKTDANEWNKNDERLLSAVEHGEVEKVASLLAKKGASAVKLDGEGKSALHVAAARGQTECLSVILAHGADLSATDSAGFTPLHLAAKNNHTECCKKLIQGKCPVDAVDGSGKSALHHAAASGNIQTVQLLCELKSPVDLKDADGLTPLLLSAKLGLEEACRALLDCGAEIDASDAGGRTALMLASESCAAAVVETLLRRGANVSALDAQGQDVARYAKLSGNAEVKSALAAALGRLQTSDTKSPRSPQHDQVAKLSDERITSPKKRKAPPPPISPPQSSGASSPSIVTSAGTYASDKSDTPKRFNYKEDEVRGTVLREEVEKLHEERNMLLETIEDLKQAVTGPEPDTRVERSYTASAALVSVLQAKINALTLENQQLASTLKRRPSGHEDLRDTGRPGSMASNSSPRDDPEPPTAANSAPGRRQEDESEGRNREEIRLLRHALESVQVKLLETRKENRCLQAQLRPELEEDVGGGAAREEKGREEELMESLAELQAKLTDTQERYHQAVEEAEELRAHAGRGEGEPGAAALQIARLEEALREAEEQRESAREALERGARTQELHREAQEEIRVLQEALRGTVPVDAAAKDFEDMKGELSEVIAGLQRRLLELSHSYSDAKGKLGVAQRQLSEAQAESAAPSAAAAAATVEEVRALSGRVEELQTLLAHAERQHSAALERISALEQEAEAQARDSVALADHAQVMSSLGNAIKELESQSESLKEQLQQKTLQAEALHNRLTAETKVTPEDSVPRMEHETVREQLEGEVSHLTQLLQGALRKQDDMALEAADAWQKARESGAERDALQELLVSRDKENATLSSRLAEAQDAVGQLKQLVENHVASEREKNKRIDDLSREVGKLKDALNSLSQLSYSAGSPAKRLQQNQQLETMQQQIKQLQYQLADTKKQHNEIVSVYRMHLLYAVQGQMDEDVQKALKQILMMCKMPSQAKEAC